MLYASVGQTFLSAGNEACLSEVAGALGAIRRKPRRGRYSSQRWSAAQLWTAAIKEIV